MANKISVITVVLNDENRIKKTIESVSIQNYSNLEFLIIDGGSTDNTLCVIKDSNFKVDVLISEPDRGIYDAMNKGVKYSSGEWIIFLNAGDTFYSENTLNEIFNVNNIDEYDVIYGINMWDYESYKVKSIKRPIELMYKTLPFCHQASLTRRNLLLKYPFDLKYKYISDYDFFRKIYFNNAKFLYINVIISNYLSTGGASANNMIKVYKENFHITKDLNILFRILLFMKKVCLYYIKKIALKLLPNSVVVAIKKNR